MKEETYTVARFWSKVKLRSRNQCWLWTARQFRYGYGNFSVEVGRTTGAHRFAWELEHGAIPDGLRVLHKCDNPPCVNPDHLFLGTQADNVADMIAKGRKVNGSHEGSANGRAVLTEDDVLEIRRRCAGGETQRALSQAFGISSSQIGYIVRRESWTYV